MKHPLVSPVGFSFEEFFFFFCFMLKNCFDFKKAGIIWNCGLVNGNGTNCHFSSDTKLYLMKYTIDCGLLNILECPLTTQLETDILNITFKNAMYTNCVEKYTLWFNT